MPTRILSFFPDTNLFIQCRPLEELDWSEWTDFEEVHLIVCRTVQREIDQQKHRGNGRVAQRARKTSSIFRSIIEEDYRVIRGKSPQVKLVLESSSVPSPELKGRLDYTKADDEIVGFLHQYKQQHPEADVRLLTHDTGPMMTARSLDLPFVKIQDAWLLPPESNEKERENRRLKEEVARLRKTEPEFQIKCVDDSDEEVTSLEVESQVYEPLSEDDLSAFIDSLRKQFPPATDFGPREPSKRELSFLGWQEREQAIKEREQFDKRLYVDKPFYKPFYKPTSKEEIAEYRDKTYPAWIKECKNILSTLHRTLQRKVEPASFHFVATNKGTRPGKDILVDIKAKGNFSICPPQIEDKEDSDEEKETELRLPLPPKPPQGKWISRSYRPISADVSAYPVPLIHPPIPQNERRDPNAFYYKDRPTTPVESFSLECEQWRHGIDDEYFDGQILFHRDTDEVRGAIEFQIHAENLSSPAKKIVPVRITVKRESTKDYASNLVMKLSNRAPLRK